MPVHLTLTKGSLTMAQLPKVTTPTDEAIRKIAMDVGKQVVAHIEYAYPKMFESVPKIAKLSMRNCVYNAIIAAVEAADEGRDEQQIKDNSEHRRKMAKIMKKIRQPAI